MAKFITIGERLSTTAPAVNKAFTERDPEPIIKRAKQQLDAGATYLDVNIGPAESDGEDVYKRQAQIRELGVPLVTGDSPGIAVIINAAPTVEEACALVKSYQSQGNFVCLVGLSLIHI